MDPKIPVKDIEKAQQVDKSSEIHSEYFWRACGQLWGEGECDPRKFPKLPASRSGKGLRPLHP